MFGVYYTLTIVLLLGQLHPRTQAIRMISIHTLPVMAELHNKPCIVHVEISHITLNYFSWGKAVLMPTVKFNRAGMSNSPAGWIPQGWQFRVEQ